jgi:hypothetical protein
VNFGDWYGWASYRICDLGKRPFFSVDVNVREWKVAFFFSHCEMYFAVKSIEVVQKFCQSFFAMGPDDESVVYISELPHRFVSNYSRDPFFQIRLRGKLL